MREIKFRAWDKRREEMIPWVTAVDLWHRTVTGFLGDGTGLADEFGMEDLELMQYTGLKDKNGKEIYELDVISVDWGIADAYLKDNKYDKPFVVEWRYYAYPPFDRYLPTPDCIEVIGNIWENPESIK